MTPLFLTLNRWKVQRHEWGFHDCMIALADWVQSVRGFDPAAGLRGTYGDPAVCPLARAYRADPEPLLRKAFADLPLVDVAEAGDVALVALPGQRFQSGALCLPGGNWALRGEGGVLITRAARPVLVWGVGYA
jgi:hypothetical protein